MFEAIQSGLSSALRNLSGRGKLTEANMREGLKLVERALLEADVSYSVVKDFMARVTEEAVGEKGCCNRFGPSSRWSAPSIVNSST